MGNLTGIVEIVLLAIGFVSCLLAFAREWFVLHSGKVQSKTIFWVSTRIVFMLALAALWFSEHQARMRETRDLDAARAQLRNLTLPHLNPAFTFSIAPSGTHGEDTVLTVFIDISNTGAPSSTDDFRVAVTINGTTVDAQELTAGQDRIPTTSGSLRSPDPSAWMPVVSKQPIANGGRMSGWEQYLVPGVAAEQFTHRGAGAVFLRFYDVNNALYEVSRNIGEEGSQPINPQLLQPSGASPSWAKQR